MTVPTGHIPFPTQDMLRSPSDVTLTMGYLKRFDVSGLPTEELVRYLKLEARNTNRVEVHHPWDSGKDEGGVPHINPLITEGKDPESKEVLWT